MLSEIQKERIKETWSNSHNFTWAVQRVGPKYRDAARSFIRTVLQAKQPTFTAAEFFAALK